MFRGERRIVNGDTARIENLYSSNPKVSGKAMTFQKGYSGTTPA